MQKRAKKTKQYLEIASAAGLLRLTPITPSTIRISFVKGVTGTIQDTNWKAQADTAVTWGAKESRSEVQLLTDRILIRVEKANGAVQFLSRDGKKLLTENPSEPRLLLDSQTWNFFAWDINDAAKVAMPGDEVFVFCMPGMFTVNMYDPVHAGD